jgi:hypothetical protein
MFKGLKHTVGCECGETTIPCKDFDEVDKIEASSQVSDCCKSKFKYIGLQPLYESILAVPIKKANPNLVMEAIITEPIIENIDGTSIIVEEKVEEEIPKTVVVVPTGFVPESIKEEIKKVETPKTFNNVGDGIPGLIEAGPKGFVTNTQMIPVLKELVDINQIDKVTILKDTYPEVFEKSIKYLPKKYQDKLK